MNRRSSAPNIKDVAQMAGVSTATVSHVINGTRYVSDETKQRVRDSIDSLGYVPNAMARVFKTGKKDLVGFIVPDIASPYWALIIEEVESALAENGYRLLVVNTRETPDREVEALRMLSYGICDGVIVASTLTDWRLLEKNLPKGYPVVLVDRSFVDCPLETITVSNYHSIYTGVKQLINQGHTRIGFITGLPRISTSIERLEAYRDVMAAHDLSTDGLIQEGNALAKSPVLPLGSLIDRGCSAVVVSNNVMANDTILFLAQRGLQIGKDISLLCYNEEGRNLFGFEHANRIVQPCSELGRIAAERIQARIQSPGSVVRNSILYSTFIPAN